MADIEIIELNSLIIGCLAIFVLIFVKRNKLEFSIYIPGLFCIIIVFIIEVFENEMYEEIFDFFENAAFLSGVALLLIAAFKEYYESNPKRKNIND